MEGSFRKIVFSYNFLDLKQAFQRNMYYVGWDVI